MDVVHSAIDEQPAVRRAVTDAGLERRRLQ